MEGIRQAQMTTASAAEQVEEQIATLENQRAVLQAQLRMVCQTGSRAALPLLVAQISSNKQAIESKRGILNNLRRETAQLVATATNATVAGAMAQSAQAQRALQRLELDPCAVEDVVESTEELRDDAVDVSEVLASTGLAEASTLKQQDIYDALDIDPDASDLSELALLTEPVVSCADVPRINRGREATPKNSTLAEHAAYAHRPVYDFPEIPEIPKASSRAQASARRRPAFQIEFR